MRHRTANSGPYGGRCAGCAPATPPQVVVDEIRAAPDRPGLELVVIARRIAGATE
jgi:hypothetical protein